MTGKAFSQKKKNNNRPKINGVKAWGGDVPTAPGDKDGAGLRPGTLHGAGGKKDWFRGGGKIIPFQERDDAVPRFKRWK